MMLTFAFFLLLLLFIIPFAPGIREFRRQDDAKPLFINMDFRKYPRYFALSFRKKLTESLNDPSALEGSRELLLSKREQVQIVDKADLSSGAHSEHVLYVLHDLESGKNVTFDKEVYIRGASRIGEDNRLQAMACDGDMHIGRGTRISRWLDAEESIVAESSCSLGVDVTCGGMLSAARACTFMRLFGSPVFAGELANYLEEADDLEGERSLLFCGDGIERNLSHISASSLKNNSIIATDSLTIGDYSVIRGHIKTHRDLLIGAHVTITGNVFADGNIEIGSQSRVLGTVFSQQHISVKDNARIGSKHRIKSLIGKKSVTLEQGVRVYGLIMTEGKGSIV
jgi:acyl-[acyl carrier protein]--UDP-N-acetylglucosamine O-acyltransferase